MLKKKLGVDDRDTPHNAASSPVHVSYISATNARVQLVFSLPRIHLIDSCLVIPFDDATDHSLRLDRLLTQQPLHNVYPKHDNTTPSI